jgi:aryl-phospho-beta-D-glucosidase BglC (GH1 family)
MRLIVIPALLWAPTTHAATHAHSAANSDTKIRGVNLGGWLVLEPWITPGLFAAANDGVARASDNSFQVIRGGVTCECRLCSCAEANRM